MNYSKIFAITYTAVVVPIFSFLLVDFLRGASSFITPYLIVGFLIAAIIPSFVLSVLLFPSGKKKIGFWKIGFFSALAVFFYLPIGGLSQVGAESFAAKVWEQSGEPLGDHGSYREFYPGDSGMAHYATPWHFLLTWGISASIFWIPILLIGLGLSCVLERLVGVIPVKVEWK